MLLLMSILLAIFVLPAPWNLVVVIVGVLGEVGEAIAGIWYSRRRQAAIGVEGMIGGAARVVAPCRPEGAVSYKGERWQAFCKEGAGIGERVRIESIEGLTLVVGRVDG